MDAMNQPMSAAIMTTEAYFVGAHSSARRQYLRLLYATARTHRPPHRHSLLRI